MATQRTSISQHEDPTQPSTEVALRCAAMEGRVLELEAELARLKGKSQPVISSTRGPLVSTTPNHEPSTVLPPASDVNEERFRLLAEYSTDMISRHLPDGRYIYVSPASRSILGRTPEQVVGYDPYEFMAPEDRHIVRDAHKIQLETPGPNTVTYRLMHPNGKKNWVESISHCIVDQDNKIQEIHVATRNVNDRVLAQQALIKSEEAYRSLIECATDLIFRLDSNYRILYINKAVSQETREFLLGTSFFDRVEPKDHTLLREVFHKVFVNNEHVSIELKVIPVSCEAHWYSFRFAPIQEDGVTVAATAIATDITHRKETDQALLLVRSAIENVQDAVIITSPDLDAPGPNIVYVNHAFETMTGYTAKEVLGKNPRILQGPKTDRNVLDTMRKSLAQRQMFHGETINYKKDGSEYHLEWDISPIRNEQGEVINYVSIQRDITEWRRQEETARHHQAELAHVGRLSTMGEMASGLAHELNQPLTAITNYTRGCLRRLAATPHADPKIAQAIELAALQADRAGQIIRRLRQFIRKRVPQHVPVAINNVVQDTITLISGEVRQYQINLQCDLALDLPMVKADHIQIEQVVLNLLRNSFEALTHLPTSVRQVTIYTRLVKGGVRLSVSDNGSGMDKETALRIFEPFFTTKNRGLGMGLPICQSIIESHNGQLWADQPNFQLDKLEDRDTLFPNHTGGLFHLWLPQLTADDLADCQETAELTDNFI